VRTGRDSSACCTASGIEKTRQTTASPLFLGSVLRSDADAPRPIEPALTTAEGHVRLATLHWNLFGNRLLGTSDVTPTPVRKCCQNVNADFHKLLRTNALQTGDLGFEPRSRVSLAPVRHRVYFAKSMASNYMLRYRTCSHCRRIAVTWALVLVSCCQIRVIEGPPLRPPEFVLRRRMLQFSAKAGSIDLIHRRAVMSLPSAATADSALLSCNVLA
jgi:hypothetical protein